jgi:hypothetical protein
MLLVGVPTRNSRNANADGRKVVSLVRTVTLAAYSFPVAISMRPSLL